MNIKDYYTTGFRKDLGVFMPDSRCPYFGHSWEHDCSNLNKISTQHRGMFLICLYFTVLVDQTMYTHYQASYKEFEEMTRYPKFCQGLGQFQKNPRGILSVPVVEGFVAASEVESHLSEGMGLFVEEGVSFLKDHMPAINSKEFFEKLIYDPDVQIPELLVMLNESLRNDVSYKAYKALCAAVTE